MKRSRSESSANASGKRFKLKVEEEDATYLTPWGWEQRTVGDDHEGYDKDGLTYYRNLVTGDESWFRPMRGSHADKIWIDKSHTSDSRIAGLRTLDLLARLRAAERFPPRNYGGIPRMIPRPGTSPSSGSQKWGPSFSHLHEYTNQSGLTPPANGLGPQSPLSPVSFARYSLKKKYHKLSLHSFDLEELYDQEAIDPYKVQRVENTLSNEIVPLLTEYWLTPGPGMWSTEDAAAENPTRFWDMEDEEVSQVMKPILRLCSRFITDFGTCDWWDALMRGRRSHIEPSRIPPEVTDGNERWCYQSFQRRSFYEKISEPLDWETLNGKIDFSFREGVIRSDESPYLSGTHAMCVCEVGKRPRVYLTWGTIMPLMPSFQGPPLSDSERIVINFTVAYNLLHEIAHAVGWLHPQRVPGKEAYFEDEFLNELGASMENSFFGSKLSHGTGRARERPLLEERAQGQMALPWVPLWNWSYPWPSELDVTSEPGSRLATLPLLSLVRHPISLPYMVEIQQDFFWQTVVKQYGAAALKPYPKIFGRVWGKYKLLDPVCGYLGYQLGDPIYLPVDAVPAYPPPSSHSKYDRLDVPPNTGNASIDPDPVDSPSIVVAAIPDTDPVTASQPWPSTYAQQRNTTTWRIAQNINERFREIQAQQQRMGYDAGNLEVEAQTSAIIADDVAKENQFLNIYYNLPGHEDELEDLVASKGFYGDLGIRATKAAEDAWDGALGDSGSFTQAVAAAKVVENAQAFADKIAKDARTAAAAKVSADVAQIAADARVLAAGTPWLDAMLTDVSDPSEDL